VEPAEITIGALETGSFVLHHAPRELSTDAVYRVMVTPSFTTEIRNRKSGHETTQ